MNTIFTRRGVVCFHSPGLGLREMGSVFVESLCTFEGDTVCYQLAWSKSDPVAALITNTVDEREKEIHSIMFVNNEGSMLHNSTITNEKEATAMDWQPGGRILTIGWKDGMISCWLVDGNIRPSSTFSNTSQHNNTITLVKWNPTGKKLVTGDKRGVINVWSVDSRGTLSHACQYRKQGAISTAVFCPMTKIPSRTDGRKGEIKQLYSPPFFFGTEKGGLVYADDIGYCADVQQLSSSIDTLLFLEETSKLVVITRSLMLMQYQVSDDGHVHRVSHGKLSAQADLTEKGLQSVNWAGPGLLAAATHEKMVRLYDLVADETYNLSLTMLGDMVDRNDQVLTMAFSPIDRYLAVGTRGGILAIWRYIGPVRSIKIGAGDGSAQIVPGSTRDWELYSKMTLPSTVHQLEWGSGQGTLGVIIEDNVLVFSEAVLRTGCCGDLSVLQTRSHEVSVDIGNNQSSLEATGMLVKGVSVARSCFAIWSGKNVRVYGVDLADGRIETHEPFASTAQSVAIGDMTYLVESAVFLAEGNKISIANFRGTRKGTISFSEAEGIPEHIDIKGKYLAAMTNKGTLKVFDVSQPTKPKAQGSASSFFGSELTVGQEASTMKVRDIRVNCAGTRVAVLVDHVEGALKVRYPDHKLHVYDRNKGGVCLYDFSQQLKCPMSMAWDDSDDRLIAIEACRDRASRSSADTPEDESKEGKERSHFEAGGQNNADIEAEHEVEIVMLFATSEHGILLQDSFPRKFPYGPLLGISVPRIMFRSAPPVLADGDDPEVVAKMAAETSKKVYSKVMRDFVGLESLVDEQSKVALIEFSYNVTLGKLDEAYRSVKAIDSPSIWENMAHMCVKTKRMDVAEVCLGNMGHARGAAALRTAKSTASSSLESNIGVLAIQLGLLDDAARLFREAGRHDMLNNLYQSTGLWDKAIKTAVSNDRIHLKTTHFQYAKFLESIGDTMSATKHYELSDTFRSEVPRMMYNLGYMEDLETYVQRSSDPALLKWWAQYLESKDDYDRARKYYSKAADYLSLVRIFCFQGDMHTAAEIITESGDKAAAYHFARQLEAQGDLTQAITYYASSGCYNHAIRLARLNHMDTELMRFALKASPSLMLDCASHFEQKQEFEKAIQLYHKGGDLGKALDLCFRGAEALNVTIKGKSRQDTSKSQGIFEMMNDIAADLGVNTSPQTLARCAEFLMQHRQFERAIDLYIMAKRFLQAIEMCAANNITITEEMAEKLTPEKVSSTTTSGKDEQKEGAAADRAEVLIALAKALKTQGSFVLASKKYTQAGDRVRAIKCLVRSGDTRAVIQFATITRNNEIYKLAANYLQQMNWRESVDIMKAIITFYTKAKAFEQLAGFYDSCAQVEIDEYRDYEKAQGALREALKYLQKAESRHAEDMVEHMSKRISIIEKFVHARKLLERNPESMVEMCEDLLKNRDLEEAMRAGDCYALLIDYYFGENKFEQAYHYMKDMEGRGIEINPYIESRVVEEVYRRMGITLEKPKANKSIHEQKHSESEDHDDIEDEIDEEIGEEFDDPSPKKSNVRGGYAQARYVPRK